MEYLTQEPGKMPGMVEGVSAVASCRSTRVIRCRKGERKRHEISGVHSVVFPQSSSILPGCFPGEGTAANPQPAPLFEILVIFGGNCSKSWPNSRVRKIACIFFPYFSDNGSKPWICFWHFCEKQDFSRGNRKALRAQDLGFRV